MRLWSIHPSYLDSRGLCGVWREALLAQNVLLGKTKGYKNHPQLDRFKKTDFPIPYIGWYLSILWEESIIRDYNFDKTKIIDSDYTGLEYLTVTKGQLIYEFNHLQDKLFIRDKKRYDFNIGNTNDKTLKPHPMFTVIDGDIEEWEKIK